jgi:predicted transcriptional regulator
VGSNTGVNVVSDQVAAAGDNSNLITLAADIVSAFVSNNSLPPADLPAVIASVHAALQTVTNPAPTKSEEKYTPAVPVKRSVTPDAITSLIDGKAYKSLKRHLKRHGLTPEQYRERYGLPRDYPMVAPNYAARRSELAKQSGLGQQRRKAAAKRAETGGVVASKAPRKGGRKKAG